jgi:hypothetical protein
MTRMVLALAVLFGSTAFASAQIVNPRVTTDSSIDCSSAQAVVKQITRPGMTDEEKAVACWRFMLDHFYHWYNFKSPDSFTDERDFARMINSYGYGPCFVVAPVQTALWEAAGLRTRCWTITGHTIPEVYYGGAWHLLDPDARAWHRKADGQIASIEELSKDPSLFANPKEKSDPYYPFGAPDVVCRPLDPWGPPSRMMDLYASTRDNYRFNKRAVMGHPMYLTLRPGERIVLSADNEGQFYDPGLPKDRKDTAPTDVTRQHTYGNGHLIWEPNFLKTPLSQSLWTGSRNLKDDKNGHLAPVDPAKPGIAVFRVWCPYAILGAELGFGIYQPGPGLPNARAEVSTDDGRSWQALEALTVDGSGGGNWYSGIRPRVLAGRYSYLVRITTEKAPLYGWRTDTLFQLAPLSLPRLKVGKNKVTVFRGPDEGVVALTLANGNEAKPEYIVESKGLKPKALAPATYDEPGYAVFKLTAPAELTALSIGGHLTMDPGRNQYIEAFYSLDGGKSWTSVWRLAQNTNPENSSFEEDVRVPIENSGVTEALVKFAMRQNSKYFGVNSVRLYAFYRQPQPKDAKMDLKLVWQEKTGDTWTDKERALVVSAFPQEFDLECAGDAVRLKRIEMDNAALQRQGP